MRITTLALGISQLVLALMWGLSWWTLRRQPAPARHLRQGQQGQPASRRLHGFLALACLVIGVLALAWAWIAP